MNKKIISFLLLVFVSCNSEYPDQYTVDIENSEKISELVEKYALSPVTKEERELFNDLDDIQSVSTPEQLEFILKQMNTVKEIPADLIDNVDPVYSPMRLKIKSEIGQSTAVISGSNANGAATVYVDLLTPSVISSTYQLGIMDAFVAYTHILGSARRNGYTINFSACGQGVVKLIWEGVV
ncbi:hypothetical protein NXY11_03790 [Parabacteroides faecis]|uniref:hypothetical protein n=1 Tax=Parabacteroides faecis TaxID=1217282 RepID=UPI0021646419|nr:hypothetical protein [Parabacteroides faecis]UVQ47377.1 hypothetical protein NXY11_03790 [Parabacteroides faecis]